MCHNGIIVTEMVSQRLENLIKEKPINYYYINIRHVFTIHLFTLMTFLQLCAGPMLALYIIFSTWEFNSIFLIFAFWLYPLFNCFFRSVMQHYAESTKFPLK